MGCTYSPPGAGKIFRRVQPALTVQAGDQIFGHGAGVEASAALFSDFAQCVRQVGLAMNLTDPGRPPSRQKDMGGARITAQDGLLPPPVEGHPAVHRISVPGKAYGWL